MANTWQARKKRWSQYYNTPDSIGSKLRSTGTTSSSPFSMPYAGAASMIDPVRKTSRATTLDPSLASAFNSLNALSLTPPPQLAPDPRIGSTVPDTGGLFSTGGGGGGGSGTAPGVPQDPWSGFAGNYAGVASDFFDSDPQIFIRDAMKAAGFDPDDGLMELMENKSGMLQFLAMLGMGSGKDSLQDVTPESYLNFINQWTKDMLTPGKGSGDVWGMVESILDAPGGSALNAYLQDGTPQQQAEALNTLVSVATASLPSVFRQAIGGMMEDRTNDWLSNKAKGKKSILADFLQQGGNGLLGTGR
jgi:hypothetical protein